MQQVDLTTLVAICHEIAGICLPAKLEQVHQYDRHTIYLCLRTIANKQWMTLSWHPQAARIHLSPPPPRQADTFTFSQQIWHQVAGLALVAVKLVSDWERVVDLQFALRPGDEVLWHLYVEVMGKYSNAILVNAAGAIVTAAHQVSAKQSRVRPIQTGDPYEFPPALLEAIPSLAESLERWRDRLTLIPQPIQRSLQTNYRGLSSALARSLLDAARIDIKFTTDALTDSDWQNLFRAWQTWLKCLATRQFAPRLHDRGYTVIGGLEDMESERADAQSPVPSTQYPAPSTEHPVPSTQYPVPSTQHPVPSTQYPTSDLLHHYYSNCLQQQDFQQLYQQVAQVLNSQLARIQHKADDFEQRLQQSQQADRLKTKADLLMAHLQNWQPGMTEMTLLDFMTDEPVAIALDPQLNAVQNAQTLYKKHRKQKRAAEAIAPLLEAVNREILYLEQVATAAAQIERADLKVLQEIRLELIQQGYLKATDYRAEDRGKLKKEEPLDCHRYKSPSGFEIWVGRNNYQNDLLTFRVAGDYDLWFHTQEIPGSHVLLRLEPGSVPDRPDLQAAANLAAYYSRARQSDMVPVVFTKPKHVFKPKGAKPGMAIYKQERVIWGHPSVSISKIGTGSVAWAVKKLVLQRMQGFALKLR